MAKAQATASPERVVLAADTIVALGETELLGKPSDREDAVRMLQQIQGREHRVLTGFTLINGEKVISKAVETRVTMIALSDSEISRYVDSEEPFGKAGAYAIQGKGAALVSSIRGSYTNVVGLPLAEVREVLLSQGLWQGI